MNKRDVIGKIGVGFFLFCLFLFSIQANCLASPENISTDHKLDVKFSMNVGSDGSYNLKASIEGKTTSDKLPVSLPVGWVKTTEEGGYLEVPSPIPSVSVNLSGMSFSISLPEKLQLKNGQVGVKISESSDVKVELLGKIALSQKTIDELPKVPLGPHALEWLSGNTEFLNSKLESSLEGKKLGDFGILKKFISSLNPERQEKIESIELKSIEFKSFSSGGTEIPGFVWDGENMYVSISAVFSGDVLQEERLENILPINAQTSWGFVNDKIRWVMSAQNSDTQDFGFSINHFLQGPEDEDIWEIYDNFTARGKMIENEGSVEWGFELLPKVQGFAFRDDLGKKLDEHDVLFELTAPENLEIKGLPSGYTKDGNTYRWENDEAVKSLLSLVTTEDEGDQGMLGIPFYWLAAGVVIVSVVVVVVFLLRRKKVSW